MGRPDFITHFSARSDLKRNIKRHVSKTEGKSQYKVTKRDRLENLFWQQINSKGRGGGGASTLSQSTRPCEVWQSGGPSLQKLQGFVAGRKSRAADRTSWGCPCQRTARLHMLIRGSKNSWRKKKKSQELRTGLGVFLAIRFQNGYSRSGQLWWLIYPKPENTSSSANMLLRNGQGEHFAAAKISGQS